MIKPRLTSVALIAAAVLATPAMARESGRESGVASPRRELRHARYARCALHRRVALLPRSTRARICYTALGRRPSSLRTSAWLLIPFASHLLTYHGCHVDYVRTGARRPKP